MLTDAKIRAAQPGTKGYKLFDAQRLYLFVTPKGAKSWRMNFAYDGKNVTTTFGQYPRMSLAEARLLRDEARRQLEQGLNPVTVQRMKVEANIQASRETFEKVARAWHANCLPQWAKVHAADVIRSFERDVFPRIGTLPISGITTPTVFKVLREIEDRSAIETAKRVRQRISAVFVYAIAAGLATTDPAEKVGGALKPLPRKGKQPAITDIAQLRTMLKDLDDDYARPVTRLGMRLIALTAVRPSELRGATWDEFTDMESDEPLWRIPAARMKGDLDRKVEEGGDHLVPLANESVAVLRAVHKLTGEFRLVFPNARNMHRPMSENALGYLLNRAGYYGRHVPHGFRASFSTIMNEWASKHGQKDDRAIIDLMLAHVPANKVEGAYNRAAYMPRRRELAQIWAQMISVDLAKPADLLPLLRQRANPHRIE